MTMTNQVAAETPEATRLRNAECALGVAANRLTEAEERYSPSRHAIDPTQDARREAYVEAFEALKQAARELVAAEAAAPVVPKIFVFCNSRGCENGKEGRHDWHHMAALAEDGAALAGHICSAHAWARHDMGIDPDGWKRDIYAAHYPDGFEVVWVDDVDSDPAVQAAFEKNKAWQAAKQAAKQEPAVSP